jgi:hypothetical protein
MLIVPEYEPAANVSLPSELKVKAEIRPDERMLSSMPISGFRMFHPVPF